MTTHLPPLYILLLHACAAASAGMGHPTSLAVDADGAIQHIPQHQPQQGSMVRQEPRVHAEPEGNLKVHPDGLAQYEAITYTEISNAAISGHNSYSIYSGSTTNHIDDHDHIDETSTTTTTQVGPCQASLDKFEKTDDNGFYTEDTTGLGDDACKVKKGTESSLEDCASNCEAHYPCGGFAFFLKTTTCWISPQPKCVLESEEGLCVWRPYNDSHYYAKTVDEGGDHPATKAQVSQLEKQIAQTDTNLNEFIEDTTETLTKLEGIEEHTIWIVKHLNGSEAARSKK